MRGVAARYAAFLRQPDVARFLAMTFVARLPLGTVSLALLLHVRELTGSFAIAGMTTGAMMLAVAATAPVIGRWIDRHGPRLPLLVTGILGPLALLVLLAARPLGLGPAGLYAFGALAGVFAPPVTVLTRAVIRTMFAREHDRRTAYALDSVLVEACFTLGPLLIAGLLAAASAWAAFAAAWVLASLAAPIFALSPAMKYFHAEPGAERHLLGPLTETPLLLVYLVSFLIAFTFGMLEVGYPAFGVGLGIAALGAVLIAINSVGSAIGGLAYGGMQFAVAPERLLPRLLAAMALPLAAHVPATSPWTLAVLAFVAGILIAPSLTMVMMLVSTRAPARYATEAFTWSATCITTGVGTGAAVGGRLVERYGAPAAFAAAAAAIMLAALVASRMRPIAARIS
jgi:MFS family permease